MVQNIQRQTRRTSATRKNHGNEYLKYSMAENEIQQIEQQKTVTGKTVLSFTKPTPMWATWIFRIVFIVTGIALFIIGADPEINTATKLRLGIYLKAADMLIWGITRSIGIDVQRDYNIPA